MSDTASHKAGRNWGRILVVAGVVALVGGAAWWFFLRPDEVRTRGLGDYSFTDPSRIYKGRAALARRPAVVDSSRVYARIPEYTQILSEGVPSDDPKYHFLMVEASKRFKQALNTAARAARHDVVAEAGTVHPKRPGAAEPPDITEDVLRNLD